MRFLCDIMTPRDINAMNTSETTHAWLCEGCLTFGRAGRSAGKYEIRQGVLVHGFDTILCWLLNRANEIVE